MNSSEVKDFLAAAEANLKQNLVQTPRGEMIAAGSRQFRTLWVRDFCYSVPGLLKLGWVDLVDRQLQLIFSFRKSALPRGIDVIDPKLRVVMHTVGRFFPIPGGEWGQDKALKAEYLGEHGTPAFDSNLLFLLSVAELKKYRQVNWLKESDVKELAGYYDVFWKEGLLHQPPFSDWQDSTRRQGAVFLTHLMQLDVWHHFPVLQGQRENLRKRLQEFFNPEAGLFFERKGIRQWCVDSHLFLLSRPYLLPEVDCNELFARLRKHPVWGAVPAFPQYAAREVAWTTHFVGLRNYHCGFLWGWLAAEATKVALAYGDEAEASRIFGLFRDQVLDDGIFWEILEEREGKVRPYQNLLYRSEGPFTWSAAKWVEALK